MEIREDTRATDESDSKEGIVNFKTITSLKCNQQCKSYNNDQQSPNSLAPTLRPEVESIISRQRRHGSLPEVSTARLVLENWITVKFNFLNRDEPLSFPRLWTYHPQNAKYFRL